MVHRAYGCDASTRILPSWPANKRQPFIFIKLKSLSFILSHLIIYLPRLLLELFRTFNSLSREEKRTCESNDDITRNVHVYD